MKINFSSEILDPYAKPMLDEHGKPLRLGTFCIGALSAGLEDDREEDGKLKFERFKLSCDIANSETKLEPIDLTAEQVATIKTRVSKAYASAAAVGRAWELLDPVN